MNSFSLVNVTNSDKVSFWNTRFEGFRLNTSALSIGEDDSSSATSIVDYDALGMSTSFALFDFESGMTVDDLNDSFAYQSQYRYEFMDSFIRNIWFSHGFLLRSKARNSSDDGPIQLRFYNCSLNNVSIIQMGAVLHLTDTSLQYLESAYSDNRVWTGTSSPYVSGGMVILFSKSNALDHLYNVSTFEYNQLNSSIVFIDNSHFLNNWNSFYGGVFSIQSHMEAFGLISITYSHFAQNHVENCGGVIHYQGFNYIANFIDSSSFNDSQLSLIAGLRLYVHRCTFLQNGVIPNMSQSTVIDPSNDFSEGGGGVFHIVLYHNTSGGSERKSQTFSAVPNNMSVPLDDEIYLFDNIFNDNFVAHVNQSGGALFMHYVLDDTNYTYFGNLPDVLPDIRYHVLHMDHNKFTDHNSNNSGGTLWFWYDEIDRHRVSLHLQIK
ncbi:hypothetical protein RFI_07892 [Reticulomyxa filosa]|uniref:Uncharacterized protein n=1 Tax=Reticulomyxa filosa TaxID=46433 RepID=X6NTA0_RETFI|nr:hypothetical protein RFI_07892 [Reticulomyxa filosa]|eukprot:ETO29231.1 hypothetical protein RFI_07892 [Reticulomyxa filosa]